MFTAVDLTLTARAREAVEYALMEAGALGTEFIETDGDEGRVSAYFDSPPGVEEIREALLDALRIYDLESSDVRSMSLRDVSETDWLAEWKREWRPVEVGERFIVAPPWSDVVNESKRLVIRIEPGMAFGTGTHETTRLCLAAIEKHFRGGSFLDVGTGTGVLAIAAAMLQPTAQVDAIDNDPVAIDVARENAARNSVARQIRFRVGSLDDVADGAGIVCANLTADVITHLLPSLLARTHDRLILSGILGVQEKEVRSRLGELGAEVREVARDGEWIAITVGTVP
jgi:ribosomal protein L11 methyltransferase